MPTSKNGQTHSNSFSAKADELFECVSPFCGVGALRVKIVNLYLGPCQTSTRDDFARIDIKMIANVWFDLKYAFNTFPLSRRKKKIGTIGPRKVAAVTSIV